MKKINDYWVGFRPWHQSGTYMLSSAKSETDPKITLTELTPYALRELVRAIYVAETAHSYLL